MVTFYAISRSFALDERFADSFKTRVDSLPVKKVEAGAPSEFWNRPCILLILLVDSFEYPQLFDPMEGCLDLFLKRDSEALPQYDPKIIMDTQ